MKIAIIGSGISGLSCAYLLHRLHDIQVFETNKDIGGHTATIDVEHKGRHHSLDTGFIVYNDWTYPNFIRLMNELGVASQTTEMSFSVSCPATGLEYAGSNLNTLFAQRANLLRPQFWLMLKDIVRFNRDSVADLTAQRLSPDMTLGHYLQQNGYGRNFIRHYLVPMGSAIWSARIRDMLDFPLIFFLRFFKNHGLLSLTRRPQWRVIKGGSRQYLEPLTRGFRDRIHCQAQLRSVERQGAAVQLHFASGDRQTFDQVVFACHSDQALALLSQASTAEQEILSALPYRDNDVVLHWDHSLLPQRRRAWSSWNYRLGSEADAPPTVTYNMNILQGIHSEDTFCVTLNASESIAPDKIIGRYRYAHPQYSLAGIRAQQRWQDINGPLNTWYCGAYWRNGFHEDGCWSGIRVAKALGATW